MSLYSGVSDLPDLHLLVGFCLFLVDQAATTMYAQSRWASEKTARVRRCDARRAARPAGESEPGRPGSGSVPGAANARVPAAVRRTAAVRAFRTARARYSPGACRFTSRCAWRPT